MKMLSKALYMKNRFVDETMKHAISWNAICWRIYCARFATAVGM